jgi:hypothetical protein
MRRSAYDSSWKTANDCFREAGIDGYGKVCKITINAETTRREDVPDNGQRRYVMGDRGGKKDKEKGQKQNADKQNRKSKDKLDKQPKRKP